MFTRIGIKGLIFNLGGVLKPTITFQFASVLTCKTFRVRFKQWPSSLRFKVEKSTYYHIIINTDVFVALYCTAYCMFNETRRDADSKIPVIVRSSRVHFKSDVFSTLNLFFVYTSAAKLFHFNIKTVHICLRFSQIFSEHNTYLSFKRNTNKSSPEKIVYTVSRYNS